MKPKIILVVAASVDRQIIGNSNNQIPWPRIPTDMKHFRKVTIGNPVIMGRVTLETFHQENNLPKPLPERLNIVVTRQKKYRVAANVWVVSSIEEAIIKASLRNPPQICIIGGQQIYEGTIHLADEIHYTEVQMEVEGTTHFPLFKEDFHLKESTPHKEEVKFPNGKTQPIEFKIQHWIRQN